MEPDRSGASRRAFLARAAALGGVLFATACDRLSMDGRSRAALDRAETLTERFQRFLLASNQLAPEYSEADISKEFRANGSTDPDDPAYQALATNHFTDWRLEVAGLVETPKSYSLAELRAFPARTQITRHDCVEGWSCIGKWTGVPLATVLKDAGLKGEARYIVFRCADKLDETVDESGRYYESIAIVDAFHPQTILAYEMNGAPLPIPHGAPLRLRLERQLGYKMAKYIMRIEAVTDLSDISGGNGGFWEDRGYEWYAGI